MILIDANLLIYAVNEDAALHSKARSWLEGSVTGRDTVALSWSVLLAFIRLTTRVGMFRMPLPLEAAFKVIEAWLDEPAVIILEPGPNHFRVLRELLLPIGTGGNLSSDAHLAAMAIEHGAELCTTDHDFSRFPRLRWRNPLT
jgi:hypothetical protein